MKFLVVIIHLLLFCFNLQGAVKEFRLLPDDNQEFLTLSKIRELNQSPSDADQPGVVTVSVHFQGGKKIGAALFEKNLPRSGRNDFHEYTRNVIDTWKFSDSIDANGAIYYTVMTNGDIKINTRKLKLPNYKDFKLADSRNLVRTIEFRTDDLFLKMDPEQVFGAESDSIFHKLGLFYTFLFSSLLIALIFFTVYSSYQTNRKLLPPYPKFIEEISNLWIKTASKIGRENRLFGLEELLNGDSMEDGQNEFEYEFIENLAGLMKSGKMNELEEQSEKKVEDGNDYKELGIKIMNILNENNESDNGVSKKTRIFEKVKMEIWDFFLLKYINQAKKICLEYKDYRLSRIFLTGLNAHLMNKDQWFSSSEIDKAVGKRLETEYDGMKGGLEGLWIIGSVSPMLGLFGTVTGISMAFARINETSKLMEQSELIRSLAEGINTALYTTIVGLAIGIIAVLLFYYFQFKIDHITKKWEKIIIDITVNF